jgi:hypothetical protein
MEPRKYCIDLLGHQLHSIGWRSWRSPGPAVERFRALIDPYVTDSSAGVREALDRMSPAERTEAEGILDRLGTFDRARRAWEEKQLRVLAALEVTLGDVLARQTDLQVVQDTREALARLQRLRNQIIGLDEDDEG